MLGRTLLVSIAMLVAVTSTARATGEVYCTGKDGVAVGLSIGRLEVLAVLNASFSIGDREWSTVEDGADHTVIAVGQAFGDDDMLMVDFMDKNLEGIIARLRVFSHFEGDSYASGGVFSLKGEGAWVVDCSEQG